MLMTKNQVYLKNLVLLNTLFYCCYNQSERGPTKNEPMKKPRKKSVVDNESRVCRSHTKFHCKNKTT